MRYFIITLLVLLCGCQEEGQLYIDLWWEIPGESLLGDCNDSAVDEMVFTLYNEHDDIIDESYPYELCDSYLDFPSLPGGKYTLVIDGYTDYPYRHWSMVCTGLNVDGSKTPSYECEIPLVRGQGRR